MKDVVPPPDNFKNLTIPRKDITEVTQSQYRVYVSAREFVLVTAENAQNAILASGVKDPVRVMRYSPTHCNVLEFPLGGMPETAPAAAPAPQQTPAQSAAAVPEAPQGDAAAQDGAEQSVKGD